MQTSPADIQQMCEWASSSKKTGSADAVPLHLQMAPAGGRDVVNPEPPAAVGKATLCTDSSEATAGMAVLGDKASPESAMPPVALAPESAVVPSATAPGSAALAAGRPTAPLQALRNNIAAKLAAARGVADRRDGVRRRIRGKTSFHRVPKLKQGKKAMKAMKVKKGKKGKTVKKDKTADGAVNVGDVGAAPIDRPALRRPAAPSDHPVLHRPAAAPSSAGESWTAAAGGWQVQGKVRPTGVTDWYYHAPDGQRCNSRIKAVAAGFRR